MRELLVRPDVIFLLLALACLAFVVEAANPGMTVPGATGVTLLLGAGLGIREQPVTPWGFVLIGLALLAFAAEQVVDEPGAGALGGALLLLATGLVLFPDERVEPAVLLPVSGFVGVGAVVAARTARRVRYARRPVHHPGDYAGEVVTVAHPRGERASVRLDGTWWTAVAAEELVTGQRVRVLRREGLTLIVEPVEE